MESIKKKNNGRKKMGRKENVSSEEPLLLKKRKVVIPNTIGTSNGNPTKNQWSPVPQKWYFVQTRITPKEKPRRSVRMVIGEDSILSIVPKQSGSGKLTFSIFFTNLQKFGSKQR